MFRTVKPVPGLELSKLSEPMWTLFFELHAGPWRKAGHDKRPDTRPMKRCAEKSQKIPLQSWGHPHTSLPDLWRRSENCASQGRLPAYMCLPSDPPSCAGLALIAIIQCRTKGGIHRITSPGRFTGTVTPSRVSHLKPIRKSR